jgi:hypothetical protein
MTTETARSVSGLFIVCSPIDRAYINTDTACYRVRKAADRVRADAAAVHLSGGQVGSGPARPPGILGPTSVEVSPGSIGVSVRQAVSAVRTWGEVRARMWGNGGRETSRVMSMIVGLGGEPAAIVPKYANECHTEVSPYLRGSSHASKACVSFRVSWCVTATGRQYQAPTRLRGGEPDAFVRTGGPAGQHLVRHDGDYPSESRGSVVSGRNHPRPLTGAHERSESRRLRRPRAWGRT